MQYESARAVVDAQAEDDGLWFDAESAPEAYLQQELRRLHAAVDGSGTSYDSRPDTYEHIQQVRQYLLTVAIELQTRAHAHDASKLADPERAIFDKYTPMLRDIEYGSDEYKFVLGEMRAGLEHHYAANDHHPEHFENGIAGMNLMQLTEMLCDWMAAVKRHPHGDIVKSISEINKGRFGYGDEIEQLLLNTVASLNKYWQDEPAPAEQEAVHV